MTSSTEKKVTTRKISEASPLKAAATLIQTLEIAQTEMTSFAADAARDAESARRNARAAQEIARRYQNRSYPRVKSSFDDINVSDLSRKGSMSLSNGDGGDSRPTTSNTSVTPRPKPPKMKTLYSYQQHNDDLHDVTNDIIAIAAELKTPTGVSVSGDAITKPTGTPENGGSRVPQGGHDEGGSATQSQTTKVNSRKSRGFQTPSSVDRIAQQHADELFQLSLELERTKQALKSEQRQHQECKLALGSIQSKTKSLEHQNQKLLEQLEEERRKSARLSSLEQEVEEGRSKMQLAEEDAQLALNIAKEAAEEKDQLEDELQKALEEIQNLKALTNVNENLNINGSRPAQATETPKRHVRFVDSESKEDQRPGHGETPESMFGTPMSSSSNTAEIVLSRSMVSAGRHVLRRQMALSPEDLVHQLEMTPAKSAERRQRLRQRMTELDAVIAAASTSTAASPNRLMHASSPIRLLTSAATSPAGDEDAALVRRKLEECQAACKILQTSGRRLDLDGFWWRGNGSNSKSQQLAHPMQLDAMTRQYCQNVEVSPSIHEKISLFAV
jgi:hypothetical protein